jgi:hypothetical protein
VAKRPRDEEDEVSVDSNGKPTRGGPAPVIRRIEVAEEDGKTRLVNRYVPAGVISGLIHVVLIAAFILFDRYVSKNDTEAKEKKEVPTSTKLDEPPEKEIDLTNPDQGLDSELAAAVEVDREADVNVEAPVVENEAPGLPNQEKDFASQTSQLGNVTNIVGEVGSLNTANDGPISVGQMGAGSQLSLPGMQGRTGATKEKLLRSGGGNDETEAAVGRALVWLAKQQHLAEGSWEFDGSHKGDKVAATGLCLLPFLAAGETHVTGKKYKKNVAGGLAYLKSQLGPSGQFKGAGMYTQAIGTVALCEAAGMTQDDAVKRQAKAAVDFIVRAQAGNGSWGYSAGEAGDTSIVGWQIQALKSARLANIPVPDKAFKQAESFLESVSDSGATYGYRTKGATHTLTAVGLLCRQYMGWTPRNPSLARGVDFMWKQFPPQEGDWNLYYYYYATQVMHFFDGPTWHRDWNPKMRGILLEKQITDKTPGAKPSEVGSWPKDNGFIGSSCGKVGSTALACLTLEVYYRHLPLYKRDSGGLQELEQKNN